MREEEGRRRKEKEGEGRRRMREGRKRKETEREESRRGGKKEEEGRELLADEEPYTTKPNKRIEAAQDSAHALLCFLDAFSNT